MKSIKFTPGSGAKITSLTTTSQASSALTGKTWLVRVVGVAAHIRTGTSSATAVSDGTDLYLADGDTVIVDASGTDHDRVAAIADSGSGGTVLIMPISLTRGQG